ncbi:hypothetical protein DFH27DRAFT_295600 [Peziza echinospora]|nr:hypothetical protein DFH27DRAFT_295600 [Peziza echinospora]
MTEEDKPIHNRFHSTPSYIQNLCQSITLHPLHSMRAGGGRAQVNYLCLSSLFFFSPYRSFLFSILAFLFFSPNSPRPLCFFLLACLLFFLLFVLGHGCFSFFLRYHLNLLLLISFLFHTLFCRVASPRFSVSAGE